MNTVSAQSLSDGAVATAPRTGYLQGRRVLVTGASGNLGAAIALRMAIDGAAVAMHYRSNANVVNMLLAQINAGEACRAYAVQGELHRLPAARKVFAEAESLLGGVDVLVNCVGGSRDNSMFMLSEEDAAVVIEGNLAPVVYLSEAMRSQTQSITAGRIINITSITGLVGQHGNRQGRQGIRSEGRNPGSAPFIGHL